MILGYALELDELLEMVKKDKETKKMAQQVIVKEIGSTVADGYSQRVPTEWQAEFDARYRYQTGCAICGGDGSSRLDADSAYYGHNTLSFNSCVEHHNGDYRAEEVWFGWTDETGENRTDILVGYKVRRA